LDTNITKIIAYTKITINGIQAAFKIFLYDFSSHKLHEKVALIAVGGKNSPIHVRREIPEATIIGFDVPSNAITNGPPNTDAEPYAEIPAKTGTANAIPIYTKLFGRLKALIAKNPRTPFRVIIWKTFLLPLIKPSHLTIF